MSNEKFTQGEWYLGNPFRHKDSKSEWCNLYADGEENPIAVVLLNDGCGKTYHNDSLMKAAPEMYRNNEQTLTELEQMIPAMLAVCADCNHKKCKVCQFAKVLKTASEMEMRIEQVQKKARGKNEYRQSERIQ